MKILNRAPFNIFSAMLVVMLLLSGCKKPTLGPIYTVDDAAVAVTSALGNTGGMSAELGIAAAYPSGLQSLPCGVVQNVTANEKFVATDGNFLYGGPWVYSAKCAGNTPLFDNITGTYNGSYATSAFTQTCTGARSYTVTGLESDSSAYIFNGTFTRNGAQQSKNGGISFTNTVNVTLTNITVSKSTYKITGGTGKVSINVLLDNNNGYMNLSGDIVFKGNNNATVTFMPQGFMYNINL